MNRDNKKFFTIAAALLILWLAFLFFGPASIVGVSMAAIAGWQVGGWIWMLANKWSMNNDGVQS